MQIRRLFAAILVLVILLGNVSISSVAIDMESDSDSAGITVLYIPLDNRPFNDERVRVFAASLGIQLLMPEEAYYATTLDGQTNTVTGLQYGDRGMLVQWLCEHAPEADVLVLSLDQLLSGGLMNSRTMDTNTDIVLPDGTSLSEYEVIDKIAELADSHEVYLLDSALRLASSYGYREYTLDDYYATRHYGMVPREQLEGAALTLENVIAGYPFSDDGSEALDCASLSESQRTRLLSSADEDDVQTRLQRYLNIRARKLSLSAYAVETLAQLPGVHYSYGIDDSSSDCNIQSNEIALIEKLGRGTITVIDTLDGSAQQMLTQILAKQRGGAMPSVSTVWFGSGADEDLSFTRTTNRGSLEEVFVNLGCPMTDSGADVEVLAWTSSASTVATTAEFYRLIGHINENEADGIPTILVGFSRWTQTQKQLLAENCNLGSLLSVSDVFEMPSNAIMGLSQGVGRYLMLTGPNPPSAACNQAHVENLAMNLALIFYNGSSESSDMYNWLGKQGITSTNFGGISDELEQTIDSRLTDKVCSAAQPALDSLTGSTFPTALSSMYALTVSQVTLVAADYPWNRTFEISVEISAELSTEPVEVKLLHRQFVNGISAVCFAPDKGVTREQAAKLVVLASDTPVHSEECTNFSDIAAWALPYVQAAWEQGYLFGYPDGSFGGSANMTRAEFSVMLTRCMRQKNMTLSPTRTVSFSDVSESGSWYSDAVYTLAQAGIISGYPDGSFKPNSVVTRAEAVTLLCRAFGRTENLVGADALPRFTDVPASYWAFEFIQDAAVTHFCH